MRSTIIRLIIIIAALVFLACEARVDAVQWRDRRVLSSQGNPFKRLVGAYRSLERLQVFGNDAEDAVREIARTIKEYQPFAYETKDQLMFNKINSTIPFLISDVINNPRFCIIQDNCRKYAPPVRNVTTPDNLATEMELYRARIRCEKSSSSGFQTPGTFILSSVTCLSKIIKFGRYPIATDHFARREVLSVAEFALAATQTTGKSLLNDRAALLARRILTEMARPTSPETLEMPIFSRSYFRGSLLDTTQRLGASDQLRELGRRLNTLSEIISAQSITILSAIGSSELTSLTGFQSVLTFGVEQLVNEGRQAKLSMEDEFSRLQSTIELLQDVDIVGALNSLRDIAEKLNKDLAEICKREAELSVSDIFNFIFSVVDIIKSFAEASRGNPKGLIDKAVHVADSARDIQGASGGFVSSFERVVNVQSRMANLEAAINQRKASNDILFASIGELVKQAIDQSAKLHDSVAAFGAMANSSFNRLEPTAGQGTGSSLGSTAFWRQFQRDLAMKLTLNSQGVCVDGVPESSRRRLIGDKSAQSSLGNDSREPSRSLLPEPMSLSSHRSSVMNLLKTRASAQGALAEPRQLSECLNDKTKSDFFSDARRQCTFATKEVLDFVGLTENLHSSFIRFVELFRANVALSESLKAGTSRQEDFRASLESLQTRMEGLADANIRKQLLRSQMQTMMDADMIDLVMYVEQSVSQVCRAMQYFDPMQPFTFKTSRLEIDGTSCVPKFTLQQALDGPPEGIIGDMKDALDWLVSRVDLQQVFSNNDRPTSEMEYWCEINIDPNENVTDLTFEVVPISIVDSSRQLCNENQEVWAAKFVPVSNSAPPYQPTVDSDDLTATVSGPFIKFVDNREPIFNGGSYRFDTAYTQTDCAFGSEAEIGSSKIFSRPVCDRLVDKPLDIAARPSLFGVWNAKILDPATAKNIMATSTKIVAHFRTSTRSRTAQGCIRPEWPAFVGNRTTRFCLPIGMATVKLVAGSSSTNAVGTAFGVLFALAVMSAGLVAYVKRERIKAFVEERRRNQLRDRQRVITSLDRMGSMSNINPIFQREFVSSYDNTKVQHTRQAILDEGSSIKAPAAPFPIDV